MDQEIGSGEVGIKDGSHVRVGGISSMSWSPSS